MKATQYLIDQKFNLNSVAWQVLEALSGERITKDVEVETTPWYNGRERGFCLCVMTSVLGPARFVAWARDRRSDRIVVYAWDGKPKMNPPTAGDLTDQAYQAAMFFNPNDVGLAGVYIRNQIISFVVSIKKSA